MLSSSKVRVAGWNNPRLLVQDEDKVFFELANVTCGCGACKSRILHAQHILSEKGITPLFVTGPSWHGGESIFLSLDAPSQEVEIKVWLSEILNLEIS